MVNLLQRLWQLGWGLFKNHLRLITHVGALLPLGLLILDAFTDNLTANPIQAATLRTGKTALTLLVLSLACTPVAYVFGFKEAIKVRRALGLYAFLYVSIHFLIFIGLDYGFKLKLILADIREKRYIVAGFSAGLILIPLAATSFKRSMKRLGKNWKRLHRLAYLAGLLAVTHYIWLVKADIRLPLLYGAILVFFLLLRIPAFKQPIMTLRQKMIRAGK